MEYIALGEDAELPVEIIEGGRRVVVGGQTRSVDMQDIGDHSLFSLLVDNSSYEVLIEEQGGQLRVLLQGRLYTFQVESRDRHRLSKVAGRPAAPLGKVEIRAPMPGIIVSVPVTVGQAVSAGDVLVILESMKMENEVRAPKDGIVQTVGVAAGELVSGQQLLLVVE
jgi:biotin carboxyl carrier protein